MAPRRKLVTCQVCDRPFIRNISARGKRCPDCGVAASIDVNIQLITKSGPVFDRWRQACLDASRAGSEASATVSEPIGDPSNDCDDP